MSEWRCGGCGQMLPIHFCGDIARAAAPPVEPFTDARYREHDDEGNHIADHPVSTAPVAGLRTRAIGRLNDYLSTLPVSPGRSQALVDLNVILTEERAALLDSGKPGLDVERLARAIDSDAVRDIAVAYEPERAAKIIAAEYARLTGGKNEEA